MYSTQSRSLTEAPLPETESTPSCSIDHIPPEIITQFLLFYLHTCLETRKDTSYSRVDGQLQSFLRNISLTCKRWRDIITSTPDFWAFVDIQITHGTPSLSLSQLDKWLERSRQLPLTISFEVHSNTGNTTAEAALRTQAFLQRLMTHLSRWKDVSLTFPLCKTSSELPALLTTSGPMTAPILERLSIDINRLPGYYRSLEWMTLLLASCPRLHTFVDKGMTGPVPSHVVPLSQLREITIKRAWSPYQALQILEEMPMLERCRLSLIGDFGPPCDPMICHAKFMEISFYQSGPAFFTYLVAPNLTELSYHAISPQSSSFHQGLLNFLTKTQGQITSFTIRNLFMKDTELLELLPLLSSSLEKLAILTERFTSSADYFRVENFSKDVVAALTYHEQIPLDREKLEKDLFCCPKLQVLRLERCASENVKDGLISDMVASRRAPPATDGSSSISKLFSFSIMFRYHSHPLDFERLVQMRRQGLMGTTEFGYPSSIHQQNVNLKLVSGFF